MTKQELLKEVQEVFELKNKEQAEDYLSKFVGVINRGLQNKKDKIKLDGLGTFKVAEVNAKPATQKKSFGKIIDVPAKDAYLTVKFKEEK